MNKYFLNNSIYIPKTNNLEVSISIDLNGFGLLAQTRERWDK